MKRSHKNLLSRLSAFSSDERGVTSIIFGLSLTVIVLAAGIAVDVSRATHARQQLAAAADAAALAAGRAALDGRMSIAEAQAAGEKIFAANLAESGSYADVPTINVSVDRVSGKAVVNVKSSVEMTLAKVAGFKSQPIDVVAETAFGTADVELAMSLDVTGSMYGQKLQDLKDSAKDLIDIMMPTGALKASTRIGLVPYATSVNAGTYASKATNGVSTKCVTERGGTHKYSDAVPGTNKWLQNDTLASNWCPNAKIVPLSSDANMLRTQIDSYQASGLTAGHLGTAWAWYMVSPEWASFWPAASKPEPFEPYKRIKAVLLMTDGAYNQRYIKQNGSSKKQAKKLCENMKKDGVIVYSIAFQAPNSAKKTLEKCATSDRHYFDASSSAALRGAFQEVGRSLTRLRLSR